MLVPDCASTAEQTDGMNNVAAGTTASVGGASIWLSVSEPVNGISV